MFNQMFEFQNNEVRMIIKDNQPWFVAKDVCDVLEIVNSRKALSALDDDEKGVTNSYTLGGSQEMATINESGLYHLIFKSRKKVAKEFRKWVTSEILPSIRKYGFFMSTKPNDTEKRQFIESFFPSCKYGITSDRTGYKKIIPVFPYFRSCKIAKANTNLHPDLFNTTKEKNHEQ
jgi:prophage antirepressor-like protein